MKNALVLSDNWRLEIHNVSSCVNEQRKSTLPATESFNERRDNEKEGEEEEEEEEEGGMLSDEEEEEEEDGPKRDWKIRVSTRGPSSR